MRCQTTIAAATTGRKTVRPPMPDRLLTHGAFSTWYSGTRRHQTNFPAAAATPNNAVTKRGQARPAVATQRAPVATAYAAPQVAVQNTARCHRTATTS